MPLLQVTEIKEKFRTIVDLILLKLPGITADEIMEMILDIKRKNIAGLKGLTMNEIINQIEEMQAGK